MSRHRRLAPVLVTVLVSAASIMVTAVPATASHGGGHRAIGCEDVALQAANGRYVSAEAGGWPYTGGLEGMLRARSAGLIGPWERFSLCTVEDDAEVVRPKALYAYATGGWVSAELNYRSPFDAMLRGRPDGIKIELWEEFTVFTECNGGCVSFRNRGNGKYVSAELEPVYPPSSPLYGMLRARADQAGPWELFTIIRLG